MKKLIILLVMSMMLIACSKDEGVISIDTQDILNKIANKQTFLLMIRNQDCYSCDTFEKELNPLVENDELLVYTLDYSSISEAEVDQLNIALGKYTSWPAMFYVTEGEVPKLNRYEYSLDPEGWEVWLKNMKILND